MSKHYERWGSRRHRLQHRLKLQSRQIESVFAHHRVPAYVSGGEFQPGSIRFKLPAQVETGLERLRDLSLELVRALGVPKVELGYKNGSYSVDMPASEDAPVMLLDLLSSVADVPPLTAVLGLSEDGHPLLLDFCDLDTPHVLLTGDPGSGKTTLLRSMSLSLAMTNKQSQLQLFIIDPHDAGDQAPALAPLALLPHSWASVGSEIDEVSEMLRFLVDEMKYRQQQKVKAPAIMVMIDGLDALLAMGKAKLADRLTMLVQSGAESRIHLVVTSQDANAPELDELLKANFPVRLVGKVKTETSARLASGIRASRAEYLFGKGDFLAVIGANAVSRFQGAYIGDYDLHFVLDTLHKERPPRVLARPVNVRTRLSRMDDDPEMKAHESRSFSYDGEEISTETYREKPVIDVDVVNPDSSVRR